MNAPGSIVGKAAQTYGNFQATLAAARLRSQGIPAGATGKASASMGNSSLENRVASQGPSGHSVKSEFFMELLRQRAANSTIGRGITRGANNAQYHSDDYINLKTGDYKRRQQRNRNPQDDSKD